MEMKEQVKMDEKAIKAIEIIMKRGSDVHIRRKGSGYVVLEVDEECGKGLCYKIKREGKAVCRHTRKIEHALPCEGERKFARYGEYLFEVRDGQ